MAPRYSFQDIRIKKDGENDSRDKKEPKKADGKKVVEGVRKNEPKETKESSKKAPASTKEADSEPVEISVKKERTDDDAFSDEGASSRPSYVYEVKNQKTKMSRGARLTLWGIAGVTVLFLGVSIASLLSSATVTVTPETTTTSVDMTVTADRSSGTVPFEVMEFQREETTSVPAGEQETVSRRASGTITIYNEYTTATQRLIRNTRFESPDGRVYRILESVEVPGLTEEDDGTVVPGTLEVTVYADEPGEEYNQGPVDRFTLPGLAGSPRFSSVYARSEGPLDGGFIGQVRMASEEDVDQAVSNLRSRIRDRLVEEVRGQGGAEDTVLFPESVFVVYDEPNVPVENQSATVPVTQSATLHAVLFNRDALTQAIAQESLPEYDGSGVRIENIEELDVQVVGREEMQIPEDQLEITISGQAQIVWEVNKENLSDTLAGVTRDDFQQVINDFPHIGESEAVIRPFWQRSFPEDADDIEIKLADE